MTNRRNFLKLLGLTVPSMTVLSGCGDGDDSSDTMDGTTDTGTGTDTGNNANTTSVIILGAGAAGMTAGHLLAQNGVDFRILEASSTHGGRMKISTDFADFPIKLGAEWLHVDESILAAIVNDDSVQIMTSTQGYATTDTYGLYSNGTLAVEALGQGGLAETQDRVFVDSSWMTFFDQYIYPSVESSITYNTLVTSVDYSGAVVRVMDQNGMIYEADKVIISVPAKILQNAGIAFIPELSDSKLFTLQEAEIWGGFKCFLEFSEPFYPTFLELPDSDNVSGQHLYYNAAYAQSTSANVLGLFAVGSHAERYLAFSGDAQRNYILNELDEIFAGKASQTYIKHIAQNWDAEPHIRAAYLSDSAPTSISRSLSTSVNQKLYFAGTSYTQENDWGSVHTATRSAKDAVEEILGRNI